MTPLFKKTRSSRRRAARQQAPRAHAAEVLEARQLLTALIAVDFSGATLEEVQAVDNALSGPGGTKVAEASFVGEFATLNSQFSKYSFLDFNFDGSLNLNDGNLAASMIMQKVQQDYAPYDVFAVRIDDSDFAIKELNNEVKGDAFIFVTGSHSSAGGVAPVDWLGNPNDNYGYVGGLHGFADFVADNFAGKAHRSSVFLNGVANSISHEAAHTFGITHVDTAKDPGAMESSLMTSWWSTRDASFADVSYARLNGTTMNSHQYLTNTLGPSKYSWAAVLAPGKLSIMGSHYSDTVTIKTVGKTEWKIAMPSSGKSYELTATNLPGNDSLNPFHTAINSIRFDGRAGSDVFHVSPAITATVTAFGGSGNDKLTGGSGNDKLFGGTGNDHLVGYVGNDLLSGWFGNDVIEGNPGNDTITGGAGNDTLSGGGGTDRIFGQSGHDKIDGGSETDVLFGGAGHDRLFGGLGHDILFGGDGHDVLFGGDGNDWLIGEAGIDFLFGGSGHDVLFGGDGTDLLFGGSGNDYIDGGAGNDFLFGGTGRDILHGRAGNDRLHGGIDSDPDQLYGDEGNDTFVIVKFKTKMDVFKDYDGIVDKLQII